MTFCLKENKKIIKWAWSKPIYFENSIERRTTIYLYKTEIDRLIKIKKKSSRRILLAMLIHCKVYGNKKNEFAMTYEMIKFHTGVVSDSTVTTSLRHLKETNEIKVVRQGHYENMIANMFKIKLDSDSGEVEYTIDIYDDIEYYNMYDDNLSLMLKS
jgi:hypothetical protein